MECVIDSENRHLATGIHMEMIMCRRRRLLFDSCGKLGFTLTGLHSVGHVSKIRNSP